MIPSVLKCSKEWVMRGTDERSRSLFSYVDPETRVPKDHPLRAIREIANGALFDLSADFEAMYAPLGRPLIPPEKLLRASLVHAFYTLRSERHLMERLQFDLLFRWFVGLDIELKTPPIDALAQSGASRSR